ncbi:MAG: protease pro-enzyme activation domain-containing protein [Candidatus Sulfotelmatobacter sp.]
MPAKSILFYKCPLSVAVCSVACAIALFSCAYSLAQTAGAAAPDTAGPRPLITQPVDESRLTILKGNTHPLARPVYNMGKAPADLPMERMLLVLKRSPEQETALRKLLDDQQDKASPNFHKWLTPQQYGKQFGLADSDLQTITGWLQSHGFQVGSTKGRTVVEFSGNAGQVQEAFHTTIHKYTLKGKEHWANASDPSIPTALVPAVSGILSLHNFLKKPQLHLAKEPGTLHLVPGKRPQVSFPAENSNPALNALGPQDYATIYSSTAFNSGFSGGGITIGVVARSNLFNGGQDVTNFASSFNCCGNFQIVLDGPDPGDLGGGDEAEATLDTTWSGAVAPGANAALVVSATTNTTDGIDLSETYIVENNLADIMTESFSNCELYATDAQLAFSYGMAEQAAAQGISYFVSTGDDGAEGCDDPSVAPATHPLSVNLLSSTPFNVAVGGTEFNENGDVSKYWGTEPPLQESAISYIPEDVWNESSLTNGLWSSSGGASAGNMQGGMGGTTPGVPKPSWQSPPTLGIPNDGVRDLPDVALTAASHDPYLLCLEGSCQPNAQGQSYIYFVSGTSASAPSFAGIMALVDNQMGGRQGLPNYMLYRLAATQTAYPAMCNGSNTATPPAAACIFNDVTVGNNVVPGETGTQYQAGAGYDQATGLGSVNIGNLVNAWNTVTFNPTTTTLALSPVTITHGQPVSVNISVTPNTPPGTPTGDVSLLAATGVATGQSAVGGFTLNGSGQVASSTSQLLGGNYSVTAYYAGDATYAASYSNEILLTVSPENSTTTETLLAYNQAGNPIPVTSVPFGSFVYLRADVLGVSGQGAPTGTVTFSDTFGPIPGGSSFTLNSQGNTANPNGVAFDAGTHNLSASYSGDASFNASSTTQPQTVVVTAGFSASIPSSGSQVSVSAPGMSGTTSVTVATSSGFTGTINLSCSPLPSEAACLFTPASVTGNGTASQTSVAIQVTTQAPTTTALRSRSRSYFFAQWISGAGLLFSMVLLGVPKQRRQRGFFVLLLLGLIVVAPGCSGGGSHGPPPNPGTPTGTYTVNVNAVSGTTTNTASFTLVVQ